MGAVAEIKAGSNVEDECLKYTADWAATVGKRSAAQVSVMVFHCVSESRGLKVFKSSDIERVIQRRPHKHLASLESEGLAWHDSCRYEFRKKAIRRLQAFRKAFGCTQNISDDEVSELIQCVNEVPLAMAHLLAMLVLSTCDGCDEFYIAKVLGWKASKVRHFIHQSMRKRFIWTKGLGSLTLTKKGKRTMALIKKL